MAGYAIIRVEKHNTLGTIAGIGHHLDRTRETPNADANRMHLNRTWSDGRWVDWGDEPPQSGSHLDAMKARLKDFQQRGGRIQKNAVIAIEAVMTASPEAFKDPQFDFEGWLQAQHDYLVKLFGANNIVSLVLHMDEETPHVHALVIPEIERVERRGNKKTTKPQEPKPPKPALAASQWVGSRSLLSEMQTSYGDAMSRFGLERGRERSGAKHTPVSAYYAQGAALVSEVEQLRAENARLQADSERLKQVERELADAQTRITSLETVRDNLDQTIRRVRDAQRRDAADLGVILTLKQHLPDVYRQVVDIADRHLDRMAQAQAEHLNRPREPEPDGPGPRF